MNQKLLINLTCSSLNYSIGVGRIVSTIQMTAEVVQSKEIIKKAIYITEMETKAKGEQLKCERREGAGDWGKVKSSSGFMVYNPGASRK